MAEDRQIFKEYGISAASVWALSGEEEETETALQGYEGIKVWEDMRRADHTAAAIVAGLTLPIRRSVWDVEPASTSGPDEEAAEFVSQCMDDMSHSWDALIVDALTLFPFGWSYLEQVLKKRQGPSPKGRSVTTSKYNDGRIGWRKVVLRPQTSIDHWLLDDHGGIEAMYQSIPKKQEPVAIPIQRALLFRTTTEGNKPEGISIFRAAWRPWMHRKRLEQVEGMAYTRNLAGILKVHLGPGATTIDAQGNDSDEYKAQRLIKEAYDDRLMGLIETDTLQATVFDGPKGTNFIAIGRAITRKDHEMARAALAHFITLAVQERGSYALAKDESDLFLMAVMAYLDSMREVIQRFAVERLFRLNVFPGITELPQISNTAVYKPNLGEVAKAINDLAQAQLLTIDDSLEAYIRNLAGFPELPVDLTRAERVEEDVEPGAPAKKPGAEPEQPESEDKAIAEEEEKEHSDIERFGRRSKKQREYQDATRAYEDSLKTEYTGWSGDAAQAIGGLGPDTTEEELWASLDDWLGVGLLLLMEKGYQDLLAAFILGFGSPSIGPEGLRIVQDAQTKNDSYLAGSLFADIRGKLDGEIAAILLLLKYGQPDEAMHHLEAVLLSMEYRLPLYGGTHWEMIYSGVGYRITERGAEVGPRVRRTLDPLARHCDTCPPKAKVYESWDAMVAEAGVPGDGSDDCDGRCRCNVQMLHAGIWIWA